MYETKYRSILALALLSAASVAGASEAHTSANRQLALSIGAQHLDYKEIDTFGATEDGILDSERGGQAALQGTLSYQGDFVDFENLYARFDVSTAQGDTRYQGYLQSRSSDVLIPYADSTRNRFYDVSLKLGKAFVYADDPNWQFTPYISFETRSWVRELAKPYGYRENYKHQDVGGGLLLQWANGRTVVGLDAGYAKMVEARMDAPEFVSKFTLGTSDVFTATASLDFALTSNSHLIASYTFKDFDYGISGVVNGMLEPDSKTKQQRLLIGYAVSY